MTLDEYQELAQRTSPDGHNRVLNGVLGLSGEAGECADIVKKAEFQGHPLDTDHLVEEAGDCLWYVAELAAGLGVSMGEIARQNIGKLRKRYPDGFEAERSIHREAKDPVCDYTGLACAKCTPGPCERPPEKDKGGRTNDA